MLETNNNYSIYPWFHLCIFIYTVYHTNYNCELREQRLLEEGRSTVVVWNRMQINGNLIVESSLVEHPILLYFVVEMICLSFDIFYWYYRQPQIKLSSRL